MKMEEGWGQMMDGGKRKTDTLGCVFTDGNIAGHELTDHMAQSFPKPCERVLCLGEEGRYPRELLCACHFPLPSIHRESRNNLSDAHGTV